MITYLNYGSVTTSDVRIDKITDTLGRVIQFTYDANGHLLTIIQNWSGQNFTWAQFDWGTLTIQANFGNLTIQGVTNNTSIPVITQVTTGDGARHAFGYNSWGQVNSVSLKGEVDNLRAQTVYAFPAYDPNVAQSDCPRFTQRNDYLANWAGANWTGWVSTYFYFNPNETEGWVTPPNGVTQKEFFSATGGTRGLMTRMETWYNSQIQKFTDLTWASDSTISPPLRPRVTDTKVCDDLNHNGSYTSGIDKLSRTSVVYTTLASTVKLPLIVKQYNDGGTTVYRSTRTDYLTTAVYGDSLHRLIGLPVMSYLYQGDAESGGTLVAQTGFEYDSGNDGVTIYLQAHNATPMQHDSANYGTGNPWRGNLTKQLSYSVVNGVAGSPPIETKAGYYTTGNIALTKDALSHQTSIFYDDSFLHCADLPLSPTNPSVANPSVPAYAYPTRVMDPDNFSATVSYNYDFGAPTRTTDPKEYAQHGASPTTMGVRLYDSKGRPDKALVWKEGLKYSQMRYVYDTGHNWVQTFTTVNSLNEETAVLSLLDGASRERMVVNEHPGSTGTLSAYYRVFDIMGRVVESSRPTEISSANWAPTGDDPAYIYSTQSYDWKSRPTVTTNPDGTTRAISYTGCGCAGGDAITVTDETGRQQKAYHDVQGRTVKTEMLNPNSSVYSFWSLHTFFKRNGIWKEAG